MATYVPHIGYDEARRVLDAAHAKASELGHSAAVAVMDQAGRLKAFGTMDGTPLVSITLAQMKATGAAHIGLDGIEIAAVQEKRPFHFANLNAILPLRLYPGPGAVALKLDGQVFGAVGVSGCPTPEEDHLCAQAGVAALDEARRSP